MLAEILVLQGLAGYYLLFCVIVAFGGWRGFVVNGSLCLLGIIIVWGVGGMPSGYDGDTGTGRNTLMVQSLDGTSSLVYADMWTNRPGTEAELRKEKELEAKYPDGDFVIIEKDGKFYNIRKKIPARKDKNSLEFSKIEESIFPLEALIWCPLIGALPGMIFIGAIVGTVKNLAGSS